MSVAKICLNMIVKNEMANLERCLGAVANHIDCWVIGDTGSIDGTPDFIRSFFARRGLPGELHIFPFINFEQARNAALDCAQASKLAFDYLLFDDADMELMVEDRDFRSKLEAPGYQVLQRSSGGLVYWNTRLARRDAGVRYRGVTHEYLEVPGETQRLQGVWYNDHASGANRVDKFDRDARLLTEALKTDPDNHRYWFYLAQSYRDAGRTKEAAEAYAKRADMGGWDEEAWNARLHEARCLRTLGDEGGFLRAALAAFNQRPTRAEPLYDLARFYRERGQNDASVLFSEPGLAMQRPDQDVLFLEDFVYTTGLREEFSIAANYSKDPGRKDRGHAACDWLALSREVPTTSRDLARFNLFFYSGPARELLPSFSARAVGFVPPDGWRATNPSVARLGSQIVMIQRCVNFQLMEDGEYRTADGSPIATRNFLLRLGADLEIVASAEILPPADLPAPGFDEVLGFEDARLFAWRGELWCCSTVRQLSPEGWCEQVLARIDCPAEGPCQLVDWRVLRPEGPRLHEKNWMPLVEGDALRFVYGCEPTRVVDDAARLVVERVPGIAAELFRGGSQAIEFDGGWLALVHEVSDRDGRRYYWHRFVWFGAEFGLQKVSRRFYFQDKGVEFAAGLAWHPDGRRLLMSYGVGDGEAWIATVDSDEVRRVMHAAERLTLDGNTARVFGAHLAGETTGAAKSNNVDDRRPAFRTFDLFDTLIARRDPDPEAVFRGVEKRSGHVGFAEKRKIAESQIFDAPYTIDDIYSHLTTQFNVDAVDSIRLKQLEILLEEETVFPIAESVQLVHPEDVVVSDMYLPGDVLQGVLRRIFGDRAPRLVVSSHGKRSGRVWQDLLACGPIIEHLGDNPVTDEKSPRASGIPARLTTIARRTEIESELAERGFAPLSNLVREARLTTRAENAQTRQAQLTQIQINFPLVFLANLHLLRLSRDRGWDNILFSARDCFLWSRLYEDVGKRLAISPAASYFYTGRVVRAHPSLDYLDYFTKIRKGKRNVVVDLCGTGWSLSRLLEQSPEPEADIFLLHEIEAPNLVQWYNEFGNLVHPINVTSAIRRSPRAGDNDVLEELNRAPHPAVEDVHSTGDGFVPVFSNFNYSPDASALMRVHHSAFLACCQLVGTMDHDELMAMLNQNTGEAIASVYCRMGGLLREVIPLLEHKRREEPAVWEGLRAGTPMGSSKPDRTVDTSQASKGRRGMKIAVYTIALNETAHAERWASSAIDADYRIVADTGSSDDTVERLAQLGVTVHRIGIRPWRFDDARNAALALVPSDADICLSLDMDEFLEPGWRQLLEEAWTPGTTRIDCKFVRWYFEDGTPGTTSINHKFHARSGYRWKRAVHEAFFFTGEHEVARTCEQIIIGHKQDPTKTTRHQYTPLLEIAHKEDPADGGVAFWLGRDLVHAGQNERAGKLLKHYLDLSTSTWTDERAEAMRYLARAEPDCQLHWLDRARHEAPHRREIWHDLAEAYHDRADWLNLFWASANGIERTRRTGSYLDDNHVWGYRLHDLAALACSHLGFIDRAIEHGAAAAELGPGDKRLANNLAYYRSQQASRSPALEST